MDDQKQLEVLGNTAIRIDKGIKRMLDSPETDANIKLLSQAAGMCTAFRMLMESRVKVRKPEEDFRFVWASAVIVGIQLGLEMAEIERPRPRFVS
jgi:hypothetical protein